MPDFNSLVTSKLAFGVLIGSLVATGGTAMVAFAGALPDPLQQSAHLLIGAPEPGVKPAEGALADGELDGELDDELDDEGTDADGTGDGDGHGTGPDVTGSAAFGLCTAYTNGGLSENSTAYKAFDDVEGGIDAYCDTVIGEKSDKSNKPEKPAKSEKVTGPKGAADEGADEGADEESDEGADAPEETPADGTGDAPADAPSETTPEATPDQSTQPVPNQQKTAPEAEKPAKELPAKSNGNGGGKDR